jgi:hypothetical protein
MEATTKKQQWNVTVDTSVCVLNVPYIQLLIQSLWNKNILSHVSDYIEGLDW